MVAILVLVPPSERLLHRPLDVTIRDEVLLHRLEKGRGIWRAGVPRSQRHVPPGGRQRGHQRAYLRPVGVAALPIFRVRKRPSSTNSNADASASGRSPPSSLSPCRTDSSSGIVSR